MLFNTVEFFVFLALVYGLYIVLAHRGQNRLLLVASYVFYGWWDVRFLTLILLSTVVDYAAGLAIANQRLAPRQLAAGSILLSGASTLFLVPNWSAIQQGGLTPEILLSCSGMTLEWVGGLAAAVLLPLLYTALYRTPDEEIRRRVFLVASMVANLGLLGFFKYCDFFIESLEEAARGLGMDVALLHLDVVLPVGISFYTFQTMSYTIDVYRGEVEPTRRFPDFALYVAFFPQLVAGPIERGRQLLPQVLRERTVSPDDFREGLYLLSWGLFKKVLIADQCARIVNTVFGSHADYGGLSLLVGIYAFAFQIYADFSGYTDIARGVAKLMGFELMVNFRLPYFATNPSDFWRRWHISLSTWLRDYLYIPLGGNRRRAARVYANLFVTMLLGGLWHGAQWTMVIWGAYHGLLLAVHRWIAGDARKQVHQVSPLDRLLLVVGYFHLTCLGWLIFRAESVAQIGDFLSGIFTNFQVTESGLAMLARLALLAGPLMAVQFLQAARNDLLALLNLKPVWRLSAVLFLAFSAFLHWILFQPELEGGVDFIYFQF